MHVYLKGVWHEILSFCFFFTNHFTPWHWIPYNIGAIFDTSNKWEKYETKRFPYFVCRRLQYTQNDFFPTRSFQGVGSLIFVQQFYRQGSWLNMTSVIVTSDKLIASVIESIKIQGWVQSLVSITPGIIKHRWRWKAYPQWHWQ
jgi:hypothetical protein